MNKIELLVIQDASYKGMAVCLKPCKSFVITESIIHEIRNLQDVIANKYHKNRWSESYYVIWYLHNGKIPWKGIDFSFIYHALREHKEKKIEFYITELFDLLFINYTGLGLPIINCSIITRPLTGVSQDFFYLNQINFIKNDNVFSTRCYQKINFYQLGSVDNCSPSRARTTFRGLSADKSREVESGMTCQQALEKKLYLPDTLHSTNTFYSYNQFNALEIQKILSKLKYEPFDKENQMKIKETFNEIKIKTLQDIYELATTNIKLIERLARKQANEHKQALTGL